MTPSSSVLEVRLLGSVEIVTEHGQLDAGGPKERTILALLALTGRPVSQDRLIDDVWDEPPATARKTLQTYVWRLRNSLPAGVVDTTPGGYVLRLETETDLARFERLIDEGADALLAHDPERARAAFRDAIALWRGQPFTGCSSTSALRACAVRLDELHARSLEGLIEAELGLGRHTHVVGELEQLLRMTPFRERLWEMLVLALYRCGRQADALRACRRAREALIEELGVEPGPALRELEQAVLEQRPGLAAAALVDGATARASGAIAERPTPAPLPAAGNLPRTTTAFIGRGAELRRLVAEWPERPLISLTGVGGVGKTRMAIEAGRLARDRFVDGVWICELAAVSDGEAVPHAVASALSIRPQERMSLLDSLVDAMRDRHLLVIFDNCEHVLDATAEVAVRITASCPTVSILATSREPLAIAGERVWVVQPLIPEVEGVELFCDRAKEADAGFAPRPQDIAVITGMCARLDGIPLAIELAAARVRSMTIGDLADGLQDRFRILRRGSRSGLKRHQTLREAVQWSYDLLPADDRLLFDRLGVFASGFDRAAAEEVCADDRVDRDDVADVLSALVDKSMVAADRSGPRVRYRLLETLRQYAEERLHEADDLRSARDRHLVHYANVAQRAQRQYEGNAHTEGAAVFNAEWDNLRAAMRQAVARRNWDEARRMLRSLFFFSWYDVRHELGDWAQQLVHAGAADPSVYGVAAFFAVQRGERDEALRLARLGLAAAHRGPSTDEWICWYAMTFAYWYSGRVADGWSADRTLNELIDPEGDPFAAASAATIAASHACYVDPEAAHVHLERARAIAASMDNAAVAIMVDWVSGMVARTEGRIEAAFDLLGRALAGAEQTDNRLLAGLARLSIAVSATVTNAAGADAALRDSLSNLYALRDWHTWLIVEATALHWAATGRVEPAAVLLGHLERVDIRHGAFSRRREQALETVQVLPNAESLMQRGARLDRDQVVAYALDELGGGQDRIVGAEPATAS